MIFIWYSAICRLLHFQPVNFVNSSGTNEAQKKIREESAVKIAGRELITHGRIARDVV